MKRNLVACVLVSALFCLIGCHSTDTLTTEELKRNAGLLDIVVITKDLSQYNFSKENYRIHNDTLSGAGTRKRIQDDETAIDASIAFADIALIESREVSSVKTILAVGGIGLGFVIVVSYLSGLH